MHPALEEIPARILFLAKGALAQANMHAAIIINMKNIKNSQRFSTLHTQGSYF